jgi:hypothetical protein
MYRGEVCSFFFFGAGGHAEQSAGVVERLSGSFPVLCMETLLSPSLPHCTWHHSKIESIGLTQQTHLALATTNGGQGGRVGTGHAAALHVPRAQGRALQVENDFGLRLSQCCAG